MRRPSSLPVVVALIAGLGLVAAGLWAFAAPHGFYNVIAKYPPYNRHFIHDIGAFLTGLGAGLLVLLVLDDAVGVALFANAVGAALHAVSHIEDRHLGGSSSDPWTLSTFAIVLVVATVLRLRRPVARR